MTTLNTPLNNRKNAMLRHTSTAALMLILASGLSSAHANQMNFLSSPYLSIDVGPSGQQVESGWVGIPGAPASGANAVNIVSAAFTSLTGDAFTLSIDSTNTVGANVGAIDWRDRGNSTNTDTLVEVGEDFVKNSSGIIRVTLDGLSPGIYSVDAYFLDADSSQSDEISVFVNTGTGYLDTGIDGDAGATTGGVNNLTTANVTATVATFSFTADGINPVMFVFDGTPSGDIETPLGGLAIFSLVALPEPSTALLLGMGLVGLASRRRRGK